MRFSGKEAAFYLKQNPNAGLSENHINGSWLHEGGAR
jgi:hypothetical protein